MDFEPDFEAEDGTKQGLQNDLIGLEYINSFRFLRAAEIGRLIWGNSENSIKYGQRICRKWLKNKYVIARNLPSKAGNAFVLAANGVELLESNWRMAKTGKDWGKMEGGSWSPPREWRHHLIANSFLAYIKNIEGVSEVISENELRMKTQKGKIADGAFRLNDELCWLELENHRKTGGRMIDLVKTLIKIGSKEKKNPKLDNEEFTQFYIAFPENKVDERGYQLNHRKRVLSAAKKMADQDFIYRTIEIKLNGYTTIGHEIKSELIEASPVTKRLKYLNDHALEDNGEEYIYCDFKNGEYIINKKTLISEYDGKVVQHATMTEARRAAAEVNLQERPS